MMSMRAISRSAPRSLTQLNTITVRQSAANWPLSAVKATWVPLGSSRPTSYFSTTPRRAKAKAPVPVTAVAELSHKLGEELGFETDLQNNDQPSSTINDFLKHSAFTLVDTPGKQDVKLKRKFGTENITVSFTISDLANFNPEYDEDPALEENGDGADGGRAAENDGEGEENYDPEEESDESAASRLHIVIEKPGQGALNVEAAVQHGAVVVENFYYYPDARLAHGETAEIAHKADEIYPGPPFGTLDQDLQQLMERYLEERGVTPAMAVFVANYMDVKEQREYQNWLKSIKNFVDA